MDAGIYDYINKEYQPAIVFLWFHTPIFCYTEGIPFLHMLNHMYDIPTEVATPTSINERFKNETVLNQK